MTNKKDSVDVKIATLAGELKTLNSRFNDGFAGVQEEIRRLASTVNKFLDGQSELVTNNEMAAQVKLLENMIGGNEKDIEKLDKTISKMRESEKARSWQFIFYLLGVLASFGAAIFSLVSNAS